MAYSTWGGRRPGSGRKPIEGEALTKTIVVRVTGDQRDLFLSCGGAPWLRKALGALKKARLAQDDAQWTFEHYRAAIDGADDDNIRLMLSSVHGQSAAQYASKELNLNKYLIAQPETTVLVEACDDTMFRAGIRRGDLLVVDRSRLPRHGDIAVVVRHSQYTAKRLHIVSDRMELHSENRDGQADSCLLTDDIRYLGIVTAVIHRFVGKNEAA